MKRLLIASILLLSVLTCSAWHNWFPSCGTATSFTFSGNAAPVGLATIFKVDVNHNVIVGPGAFSVQMPVNPDGTISAAVPRASVSEVVYAGILWPDGLIYYAQSNSNICMTLPFANVEALYTKDKDDIKISITVDDPSVVQEMRIVNRFTKQVYQSIKADPAKKTYSFTLKQ